MTYPEFIEYWEKSDDFIEVKTSGSTGEPKIIRLPKTFMVQSALRTLEFFNLNSESRLHSCISPDFIGGKMMAVRALTANASLTWELPSNEPLKEYPEDTAFDLVAVVPSQILYIIENKSKLPRCRNIIVGGAPVSPALNKRIAESGMNVYETYGMTETSSHIAMRKVGGKETPFSCLKDIRVETDSENCLKILFNSGEVIQTNDLARVVSEKEFFILGRRDNIIITGGRKLNPFIVEEKISSLLPYPYFISSVPDEKWGEKVVLIIEGLKTAKDELFKELRNHLEGWEMPKEIIVVDKLPQTANGKILRTKFPL